ncbi:MAG: hypothetical protein CM15mP49_01340 [Actinomycetota bacterium]|nr:MAG: hypothetical protein CM15mP49_01340 [Actinomycetota bacterium]
MNEENIGSFDLASPGFHNALNATVAVAVAVDLGLSMEKIKGISQFAGVARRFQYRGEINGVSFIDDYAHLPTEVNLHWKLRKRVNGTGLSLYSNPIVYQNKRFSFCLFGLLSRCR